MMTEILPGSDHPTDRWARAVCETSHPQDDTGHSLEHAAFAQLFGASESTPDPEGRQLEAEAFTRLFGDVPGVVKDDAVVMIGKYRLGKRLGGGGMGDVFLATDTQLGRTAAIKLLRTAAQHNEVERQRLLREAQALATLTHPNVVAVYDCGLHEGQVYLAMEHVEGETLRRWQDRGGHSWRELLACYLDAGRGLAAVHAVGLVHRDFKPQNVLRGRDGHIKIADFGLAIAPGSRGERPSPGPSFLDAEERSLLAVELTASAAVLGTPLYISPEQLTRQPVDARSDQFSFCVALYEALYGSHPYAEPAPVAPTEEAATDSHARGAVGTAPSGRPSMLSLVTGLVEGPLRVPPRIVIAGRTFRALRRGLARDPAQRFPSMQALLAELGRDPLRKAAPLLASIGLGGLLSAAFFVPPMLAVCKDLDREIASAWNPERAATLRAAFVATGSPHAEAAATHVEQALDAYTTQWLAARQSNCDDAHLRDSQSPQLEHRRQACLEQARSALAATVDQLERADPGIVLAAPEAVAQLPALAECSADLQLRQTCLDEHDDPQLRATLDRALALELAGRFLDAEAAAAEAARTATTGKHTRLAAEAHLIRGRALAELSRADAAEAAFKDAYLLAEQSDCVALAAEITTRRAKLVALNPDLPAHTGLSWSEQSEAKIKRLGNPPHLVAAHLNDRALLFHHRDELDPDHDRGLAAAQVDYTESLRIREQLANDRPTLELAQSYMNLGIVAASQGRHADAIPRLRKALDLYTAVHGPEHPSMWKPHFNLGASLLEAGELTLARGELEVARNIAITSLGPRHLEVARIDITLANLRLEVAPTEALSLAHEAETIYTAELADDDPRWTDVYKILAAAHMNLGAPALALPYRKSIVRRSHDADPETRADAQFELAEALMALDRSSEARALAEQALASLPSKSSTATAIRSDLMTLLAELSESP